MALAKKDFIEVEFTGRVKDGDIFDSNIKEDLAKLNPNEDAKPFIFCLGEGMFLKAVEDYLTGKEIGEYTIELTPDKAFGARIPQLVQMLPSKIFIQQKLNPVVGAVFNFDGRVGKVLSSSSGRVIIDFNHPLAGKQVIYKVRVIRKIEDLNEKISSFLNFIFKKHVKFSIEDKKVIIQVEKDMVQFAQMFQEKFKEIFEMDLEAKEAFPVSKETQ